MSTQPEIGGKGAADALLAQSKALVEAAEAEEAEQFAMLPPSPEEMAEARLRLGPNAGRLAVLREARDGRKGRPPGARNKRTDDFSRYILSFGPDPAVVLAQISGTPPEVLIEQSAREHVKVTDKGEIVRWIAPTLDYGGAMALRIRCAEGLMPYVHAKRPVAIDATIRGVRIVEEIGGHDTLTEALDGEFVRVTHAPIDGEGEA